MYLTIVWQDHHRHNLDTCPTSPGLDQSHNCHAKYNVVQSLQSLEPLQCSRLKLRPKGLKA
jgi:hypothetical protein